MATVAELIVRVGAQTRDLEAAFARSTSSINAFADGAARVGASLTQSVTVPIVGLGIGIGVATAKMDSLQRGLEAVAGSSRATEIQLARLTEIAKSPGIGFAEAIQGSVRLQSVGFSAALAERSLKAFANAIALTGGGRDELSRVNAQLTQLASKGKVLSQDLRPIIENAPAVGRALREAFGTVDSEAIQNLGLTTQQFLDRLLSQLEKLPQVSGGLANSFENLKDAIFRAFAAAGSGQTNQLTALFNGLAEKVEAAGQAFARMTPGMQRFVLLTVAAAAAIGPLLISLSALANAYRTLLALTLVSSTLANARAFLTLIPAIRSTRDAIYLLTVAVRALFATPWGLAITALAALGAAFFRAGMKAKEAAEMARQAADEFKLAVGQMSDTALMANLAGKNQFFTRRVREIDAFERRILELDRNLARARTVTPGAPDTRSPTPFIMGGRQAQLNQQAQNIQQMEEERARLQQLIVTRQKERDEMLTQIRVMGEEYAARQALLTQGGDLGGGGAATETGTGDKFKALREEVEALNLLLGSPFGRQFFETATQLEVALQRRVEDTNQSLRDRAALFQILRNLSTGLTGFVGGLGANQTEALNRRIQATGPADTANVALGQTARLTQQMQEGFGKAGDKARILAQRTREAARYIDQMGRTGGVVRALAGVAEHFGEVGRALADTLDRVGDVADALAALRTSQQETGQGGVFSNLSNLTSALGVLSAGLSVLGNLFGQSQAGAEAERRQKENTESLQRLASQLNRFAGTANEFRRAALAVGALQRQSPANLIGGGNVNNILSQFGLTLADLNRVAQSLGITLLTEAGRIDLSALEQLSEALGYNAALLTQFGRTLDDARKLQDARNRIFNLEVTPQLALQQALGELGRFAPLISANLLRGVGNVNTSAGREALQRAIQRLFTRMEAGGISVGELGLFQDVNQLLESILGIDDALDRFRETTEGATAAMLNVPQGFKVALARFNATVPANAPTAASALAPASVSSNVSQSQTIMAAGAVPITIVSNDPQEVLRLLAEQVKTKATAYPPLQPLADILSPN